MKSACSALAGNLKFKAFDTVSESAAGHTVWPTAEHLDKSMWAWLILWHSLSSVLSTSNKSWNKVLLILIPVLKAIFESMQWFLNSFINCGGFDCHWQDAECVTSRSFHNFVFSTLLSVTYACTSNPNEWIDFKMSRKTVAGKEVSKSK